MRATATWISLGVLALAAAGCQPKAPAPPPAPAPVAVTVAAAAPAAPAPAAAAPTPEAALAVTQALTAAQAFNAQAAGDLAALTKAEKRIRDLAAQASEAAARSGGNVSGNERLALTRRIELARTEAEAAHADVAARAVAFRSGAQAQTDAIALVQLQCAQTPELTTSEPCVKLAAEQATLAQTITTLTTRFASAEASYQKDRAKLEEASATLALAGR